MRRLDRWGTAVLTWAAVLAATLVAADEAPQNATAPAAASVDESAIEFFEKEVRPILSARCLECHGNGQGDPKGGLRLTSRAGALKGGDTGPAVVPGNLKESLLVSAIEYGDLYQMPPKSRLPANEVATLKKWVERGAPWPNEAKSDAATVHPFDLAARKAGHWCWQPVTPPAIPIVADSDWPRTTVDRFILAKLEAHQMKPAAPAEKHQLLRRVYFDLIGLPPSPDEVQGFLQDSSPQALEHVVDRLLDSVQFGERWARHWLDLVRYAETRGHEFEPLIPNAWQYRDYVIRAINAGVPYDRLLMEHIAGDLIEPRWREPAAGPDDPAISKRPSPMINESILGTGFWFLGEEVHSPVDIRKDETDRMDNRLDVMSKTFLGLTVGCARCHDHKFDAISQRDYYALVGYLISGSYRQVRVQTRENDRRIAEQLDELRTKTRSDIAAAITNAAQPVLDRLDDYLIAARQLIDAGISFDDSPVAPGANDVVFADFEGDSWGDWKTEGTAFGDRPHRRGDNVYEAPLEGFRGERLANSHRNAIRGPNTAGARDAQTGRLVSPEFTIDHNFISFLIGGGAHPGRTCMNLVVDGKTVRTATGQNSGTLRTETWQVAELRGKKAQLEIIDTESGGWGHILVDQIVFADRLPAERPATVQRKLSAQSHQTVADMAAARKLDTELLGRWCIELAAAKADRKHPLNAFLVPTAEIPAAQSALAIHPEDLVVDFGAAGPGNQIEDGVAFGLRPVVAGQMEIGGSAADPKLRLATIGCWKRDPFWNDLKLTPDAEDDYGGLGGWHRHGRMVRTPEFSLKSDRLWYLVRGSVRAYASVNSHLVIGGPLHGSLLREFKHADDQWHWESHGLELYRGNRLHVEFSPSDDGDCSVAMVVQSNDTPRLPALNERLPVAFAADSTEQNARQLRDTFVKALNRFRQRQNPADDNGESIAAEVGLTNWFLDRRDLFSVDGFQAILRPPLAALRQQEGQLTQQVQWESQLAPAMLDGNGVDEQLLIRGNSGTPRDPVHRRFLEALPGETNIEADRGSGRVQLARRMIESPVVARVAVNRVWYHLFGRGIVPTVDNMGALGQPPTHPELLDHLAAEFVKDGWSTKRLIKSLILSRTYQMSSHPVEPADTLDPDNLLWHRMAIKRLEGEAIRDALLAVSGRLNRTSFGPSVPIHLTPFMEGRGRPGASGPLDGNGRRSIYIAVRRNFLSPFMLAFDTPSPFSTVGRRTSSNVPAQALILMNDPLVIELAKQWANTLLADSSLTQNQRIDAMYLTAYSRKATDAEKAEAISFLDAQGARLGIPEEQRRTSPQAWADLCHVLFNLKEFVFVE